MAEALTPGNLPGLLSFLLDPQLAAGRRWKPSIAGLVFTDAQGAPLVGTTVTRAFVDALCVRQDSPRWVSATRDASTRPDARLRRRHLGGQAACWATAASSSQRAPTRASCLCSSRTRRTGSSGCSAVQVESLSGLSTAVRNGTRRYGTELDDRWSGELTSVPRRLKPLGETPFRVRVPSSALAFRRVSPPKSVRWTLILRSPEPGTQPIAGTWHAADAS
jgi:hypothetical protein